MSDYPWAYQCSICGEIVPVEEIAGHTAEEKGKPDWPGFMSWTRVARQQRSKPS
jgi:hypothetical protein